MLRPQLAHAVASPSAARELPSVAPLSSQPAVATREAVAVRSTAVGAASPRITGFLIALAGIDLLAAFAAGVASLSGNTSVRVTDFALCSVLIVLWPALVAANGGYERGFVGAGNAEYSRLFRAFLHTTAIVVFASFLLGLQPSRSVAVPSLGLVFVFTCVGRYAARKVLHARRKLGKSLTPVLAVGDVEAVVEFTTLLRRDRYAGMKVVGACLAAPAVPGTAAAAELRDLGVPVLGRLEDVATAARRLASPTVAVLDGSIGADRLKRVAWQLEGSRADLVVSPGLAELGGRRMHIRPVAGLPLLHIDEPRFTGGHRLIKGAFDIASAAVALVLLSPLLLVIGVLIRVTSHGPALFRQTRVGRNGREFTMVKFRSMCVDAEDRLDELSGSDNGNGVLFKLHSDPRVTSVGRVLRRFSLDELPQLFNVLTGSMSLVGPRPPLPVEVAQYHDDARRRLLVKPGLTGLWQISGRSNLSWEDSIRLDLRYVEQWSLSLDLIVLWKTAKAVLRAEGAY